ncbi:MAG TPA: carboxypeptidase-like regulatory domain-containing protein, partial [Anaeromyxobacteraceae bacterium]|nr:carboxypeptidase-like regulatory domain-containing protein [Anaeromyxobacteraceae bacterium]
PDGAFRLEAPDGSVKAVVRADGFAPALVRAGQVRGESVLPDVVLEPGVAVVVEVVDAETHLPVPGSRVALVDAADLEGSWASGEAMARLAEPATAGRGGALRPEDPDARVALHRGGMVRGRVTDPGGRPLAGARVLAVSRSALDAAEGRADAAGKFSLGPLHPGRYGVLAAAADGRSLPLGTLPVEVRDGETATADLEARSGGATVRVRVLDARGRAAAASVLLAPGDAATPASLSALLESTPVYPASGRGPRQVAASVPAGRHTLFVLAGSGGGAWREAVDVPAAGDLSLEVRLPGEAALSLLAGR